MKVKEIYKPRFVSEEDLRTLIDYYHLARTALSGGDDSKYQRMIWASDAFHKENPETSQTAAYKDLSASLELY